MNRAWKRAILPCILAAIILVSGCASETAPEEPAAIEPDSVTADPAGQTAQEPGDNSCVTETLTPPEPEAPEPEPYWGYDTPENHGMDSAVLESLHEALDETEIYTSVIIKDGVIIDEYYKDGYDSTSLFSVRSCSKSITSALVGLAIEQGYIEGVDVLISEYFPQIEESGSAWQKEITIRHLLTHSAGIEWDEYSSATNFREWRDSDNWVDYVLNCRVVSKPGTRYNYSTGGTHLLAAILQQATGRTLADYSREYLFEPLGMDSAKWGEDAQGITDGGNGATMNVYDMAKFGQLFLDGGKWEGQQIIPEEWVRESTRVQFARSSNYVSYGYQWWVRSFGRKNHATFFAQGHAGQLIFVVPELNLISVFTSNRPDDTHAPWAYFADYVLEACDG